MVEFGKGGRCGGVSPDNHVELAAGDGADDDQGLGSGGDCGRERGVGGFEGEIFFAGEEAQERAALVSGVIADGAAEHGIVRFEGVEDGALGDWGRDFEREFCADVGQGAEVLGEDKADHEE